MPIRQNMSCELGVEDCLLLGILVSLCGFYEGTLVMTMTYCIMVNMSIIIVIVVM